MSTTRSNAGDLLYVYIVRGQGSYLFIGLARNVEERLEEIEHGNGPASLKGKTPVELVYVHRCASFPEARSLAQLLKGYTRERKERLIASFQRLFQSSSDKGL